MWVPNKFKKFNIYIGAGTTILAIVALVGLFIAISDYRNQTSCQAEYNKLYSEAIVERQTATENDRKAARILAESNVTMLDGVLNPTSTVDQRRKAVEDNRKVYQDYLRVSQDTDKKRAENPLPLTPECALE
jgi:hypothetical protein